MTAPLSMHDYLQAIHDWLSEIDATHDRSSCVCCCLDCGDTYAQEMGLRDEADE